jgi:hypothetical protein
VRVRILATSLAVAGALAGRVTRPEAKVGETVEGIKELSAPVTGAELRCDVGVLATQTSKEGEDFDAEVRRAGIDVEIAPRPDYWYGLGAAAVTRTTTTTTIDAAGAIVTTADTTDAVVFSARFFKRIGPLVLSAGVVDSAGGAGLELRALGDRLRLEALASNWRPSDATAAPHLRVGGSAQWRFLYVQGGTLDVIEGGRNNVYVGLGMRWSDPDLLATLFWIRR